MTDITGQTHVETGIFENEMNQRRRCGLSITTRNTNHLGIGITSSKFNFTDDRSEQSKPLHAIPVIRACPSSARKWAIYTNTFMAVIPLLRKPARD